MTSQSPERTMKHRCPITRSSTRWGLPAHFSAPITPAPEILSPESMALEKYLVTLPDFANFYFSRINVWRLDCLEIQLHEQFWGSKCANNSFLNFILLKIEIWYRLVQCCDQSSITLSDRLQKMPFPCRGSVSCCLSWVCPTGFSKSPKSSLAHHFTEGRQWHRIHFNVCDECSASSDVTDYPSVPFLLTSQVSPPRFKTPILFSHWTLQQHTISGNVLYHLQHKVASVPWHKQQPLKERHLC